jgi:acyl-CoA dehydrogenase
MNVPFIPIVTGSQPRLIKYNRFGDEVSEIWVNEGYKKTVEESYNRGEWGIFTKRFRNL